MQGELFLFLGLFFLKSNRKSNLTSIFEKLQPHKPVHTKTTQGASAGVMASKLT